jgi:hypothetical protein
MLINEAGRGEARIRGRQICTSFVRVGKNPIRMGSLYEDRRFPGKRDFFVQILYAAPALWTFWHFVSSEIIDT